MNGYGKVQKDAFSKGGRRRQWEDGMVIGPPVAGLTEGTQKGALDHPGPWGVTQCGGSVEFGGWHLLSAAQEQLKRSGSSSRIWRRFADVENRRMAAPRRAVCLPRAP